MRVIVVLAIVAGFLPARVDAQSHGNTQVPGFSSRPNPTPPPPSAPGPPPHPSQLPSGGVHPSQLPSAPRGSSKAPARPFPQAPPSHPLPTPFAGTVPDPFIGPAMRSDVFRSTPLTYGPRYGRRSALGGSYGGGYYGGGYYDAGYPPYANVETTPNDRVPIREGRLNLHVTPATSQVFIDGFYVGTVGDFQDRGLWLEPGPRRIELRSEGYDDVTFDVRILEDQSVEYRRDLARTAARPEPPRVAAIPKTFYVIPGCYAGDSPPEASRLPNGCSPRNVRTIPPVVSRLTKR